MFKLFISSVLSKNSRWWCTNPIFERKVNWFRILYKVKWGMDKNKSFSFLWRKEKRHNRQEWRRQKARRLHSTLFYDFHFQKKASSWHGPCFYQEGFESSQSHLPYHWGNYFVLWFHAQCQRPAVWYTKHNDETFYVGFLF